MTINNSKRIIKTYNRIRIRIIYCILWTILQTVFYRNIKIDLYFILLYLYELYSFDLFNIFFMFIIHTTTEINYIEKYLYANAIIYCIIIFYTLYNNHIF